jgi:hypothetical protein
MEIKLGISNHNLTKIIKSGIILLIFLRISIFYLNTKVTETDSYNIDKHTRRIMAPQKLTDSLSLQIQLSDENLYEINEFPQTININADELEIPDDNLTSTEDANNEENKNKSEVVKNDPNITRSNFADLTTMPRQIYEVLPTRKTNEIGGSVKLKLRIDTNGKVVEHIILSNSLECENCLDELIAVAYLSKWEPGILNGIIADFWVEKSYTFN